MTVSAHVFDPAGVKEDSLALWARPLAGAQTKDAPGGEILSLWGVYQKIDANNEPSRGQDKARVWVRAKPGTDNWLCDSGIASTEVDALIAEKVGKGHRPLPNANPYVLAHAWDAWRFLSGGATKDIAFRQTRTHRAIIEAFWLSVSEHVPECADDIETFLRKMRRLLDPVAVHIPTRNPMGPETSWAW